MMEDKTLFVEIYLLCVSHNSCPSCLCYKNNDIDIYIKANKVSTNKMSSLVKEIGTRAQDPSPPAGENISVKNHKAFSEK